MKFDEIDEARIAAARALSAIRNKRGRKRKNSVISLDDGSESTKDQKPIKAIRRPSMSEGKEGIELRTGRWTNEEMAICDKLIQCFKDGSLPVVDGTKLNDFLSNILKSKQSRLTKKMKNAKLSSNSYVSITSYITDDRQCAEFSSLEENFFLAISDAVERAELKFHMRKLWKEMFSNICLSIGQSLDVDAWLSSIEEMDRRVTILRDASRMQRRQLMMGYALSHDSQSAEAGVYIDKTVEESTRAHNNEPIKPFGNPNVAFNTTETEEVLALLNDEEAGTNSINPSMFTDLEESVAISETIGKSSTLHSSPFLVKVMDYIKRHNVPFEHVDIWVPNFHGNGNSECILGFAGSATADHEIPASGKVPSRQIDPDAKFNLLAFGDYSQKFSFSVGCGLPGRVFDQDTPTWETRIGTASSAHFERSGGATQWGIKTVVGIPVPSPNVGRIVVVLYSKHERTPNNALVTKLQTNLTKLLPSPKWKLVVDMGSPVVAFDPLTTQRVKPMLPTSSNSFHKCVPMVAQSSGLSSTSGHSSTSLVDSRISEIVSMLANEMTPSSLSHDMISLRLLLLKPIWNSSENELVSAVLGSYTSYLSSGRPKNEIALMISRDYAFMTLNASGIPEVSLHPPDFNIGPPQHQEQLQNLQFSNHAQLENNINFTDFLPIDSKSGGLFNFDAPDNMRASSPTLTPIEPLSGDRYVDHLSVVSN
jgi:hypothetical protein